MLNDPSRSFNSCVFTCRIGYTESFSPIDMHNIHGVHCMALRKLRTNQGPLAFAAVFAMSYF